MSKALRDALKDAGFNEMQRRGGPKRQEPRKSQPAPVATVVVKRSIKKLMAVNT